MPKREFRGFGIGIAVVVVVIFILWRIFGGGGSGGPVIVIVPEPDSRPPDALTKDPTWSVRCENTLIPVRPIDNEDPPLLSHHLCGIVGVSSIAVMLKEGVTPPIDSEQVGRIDMTIGGNVLSLTRSKKHAMPKWSWKGGKLKGKYFRKAQEFPSVFLQEITAVAIYDFRGQSLTPAGGVSDIASIEIAFDQNPLYDCD